MPSALATAILALNPISYYEMDATSGTTEVDLGSAGKTLTYAGGFTLNQGSIAGTDPGPSVLFNGTTGEATSTQGTPLGATATYGIVGWWSSSSAVTTSVFPLAIWNDFLVATTNSSDSAGGTILNVVLNDGSGGSFSTGNTVSFPFDGAGHQVAGIYANGLITIMVDGVSVFTQTIPTGSQGGFGRNNAVAGRPGAAQFWPGNAQHVAFIQNLTVAQVANLHTISLGTFITGTAAAVQSAQTANGVAKETISGSATAVQSAQTVTAAAKETIAGTATAVQSAQTVSASGNVSPPPVTSTATAVQSAQTVTATAKETMAGTATAVQSAQNVTAAGALVIAATGTSVQSAQTVVATAKETITGTATPAQGAQTVAAAGTSITPPVTATGATAQAAQTVSATASVTIPPVTATATAVQAAQTANGTARETISGTAAPVQAAQTATGTAKETIAGTASPVQAAQAVIAAGTTTIPNVTATAAVAQAAQGVVALGHVGSTNPPPPCENITLLLPISTTMSFDGALTTAVALSMPISNSIPLALGFCP